MKPTIRSVTATISILAIGSITALADMPKVVGEGEGQVDIVAWPGYIERGETRQGLRLGHRFEKETGCKVNVKTAGTSDEMVALMNEGGFDLVTASGDASLRLVAGKRVQPINTELIPSWKTRRRAPAERALAHGRRRALRRPLSMGPERPDVQHRTSSRKRRRAGTSSSRRRTCRTASRNKGRVQAYDGAIYIADAAHLSDAQEAGARHQGPLRAERRPVQGRARPPASQRTLIGRYWHDATVQVDDFKNEGVVASGSWPLPGQSRCKPTRSRSPRPFPKKAPRAGPTPR